MNNFQEIILNEADIFFSPVVGLAKSPEDAIEFFRGMGWHFDEILSSIDLSAFLSRLAQLTTALNDVTTLLDTPPQTLSEWKTAVITVATATQSVRQLVTGLGQPLIPLTAFPEDFIMMLLHIHLERRTPGFYRFLALIGAIENFTVAPVVLNGRLLRETGKIPKIHLEKVAHFLSAPKQILRDEYWGSTGLATRAAANQVANRLFPILADIFVALGFDTYYNSNFTYDATSATANAIATGLLTIRDFYTQPNTGITADFGATIGLLPFDELIAQTPTSLPTPSTGDAGVFIVPFGGLSFDQVFGNWQVSATADANLPGIQISRDGVKLLREQSFGSQTTVTVTADYDPDALDSIRIGSSTGTRLEINNLRANAYLAIDEPKVDYGLVVQLLKSKVVLVAEASDGFLSKIIGTGKEIPFDLSMGWTRSGGFYIGVQGRFEYTYTDNSTSGGLLNLSEVAIGLQFSQTGSINFLALVSGRVNSGPIELTITRTGVQAELGFGATTGNFGPIDINLGFKFPDGVGIKIDSESVKGGGYLYFNAAAHTYAGVASLSVQDKLKLNAIGLLQTKLPNGRSGYSFLLLITAEFTPIQLGLGFTLNGIGGIVGINRTASTSALRSLVQNGRIDTLLFPASVLSNPQAAVATVDSAFPAAEGRYVFGIMAKIGWGTPNLLTLEAALIIELPAPVRLILLGVLRATLPNQSAAIIRLRADFIGIVDFGAKKISFDAVLVDSKILQFALTGNFSFRLYQGDNPVFLMTAGGFHPAFHPPANADLPTLRRLTLSLAQGGDFRLTLTSYLAITSSSVQFGSRLDLYVRLPSSFYIEGFLGFDALFRFNPFYLEVRIGAGVAIKRNGRSMLSISLNLLVSGPAPWHVDGEGSFKILFFRIRFRVNRTFGGGVSQPALPTTDVRQLLATALQDKGNWEVIQPTVKPANTVVLRTEDNPSELMVDPGGALAVRQKVVPLDFTVEVYGNTRATNGSRFDVASVTLGDVSTGNADVLTGSAVGELRDAFAPGQFRRMSDGEKLSAPAFQSLRSGLRLNTVDGLKSRGGQTRRFEFETSIITPTPSGQQRAASGTNALVSGGGTSIGSNISTTLAGANLQRLAQMGAVSKTRRSYEQRRPSRKAPDQVLWDEDSYVIVSVRNLTPDDSAPNPFPTEAEATAYLRDRIAADSALAGELQVIPVYQLDVSTSANAANLATA